jgi:hypothetical protein
MESKRSEGKDDDDDRSGNFFVEELVKFTNNSNYVEKVRLDWSASNVLVVFTRVTLCCVVVWCDRCKILCNETALDLSRIMIA